MRRRSISPNPRARLFAAALAVSALAACASAGDFVWVDRLKEEPPPQGDEYRICVGDVISVSVWNQEGISVPRARVRDDGKISLAFLQDVEVTGQTPGQLATRLQGRLKAFIVSPLVTVGVEEIGGVRVSVVGHVARAGTYQLRPGTGVLEAIAAAGGLTDYGDRNGIYVVRGQPVNGTPARIRFRYAALSRGEPRASGFTLRDRDAVVVE